LDCRFPVFSLWIHRHSELHTIGALAALHLQAIQAKQSYQIQTVLAEDQNFSTIKFQRIQNFIQND
jgi:hypothetical protein